MEVPVRLGALAPTATTTAPSAATTALVAVRHVERRPTEAVVAARPRTARAGDVVARLEAIASAANVRPVAIRRGQVELPLGPADALLHAVPSRQAGPEGATEAEVAGPLASPTIDAAVVLLAAMAVGHAEVGRPTTRVQVLDAATRLLAAAPAVVLLHAGRKHPGTSTLPIPASAIAQDGRRPKATVVAIHLLSDFPLQAKRPERKTHRLTKMPSDRKPELV